MPVARRIVLYDAIRKTSMKTAVRKPRHASGSGLAGSVRGLVSLAVATRRATPAPGRRAKFWREAGRARRAPTGGRAMRRAAWRSITMLGLWRAR